MRAELDKPITEEEIWEAISKLKNNKSPEPGGNSNEFYKTFREIISPLLLNAVHTFLETGTLAPLWNDAAISLDAYKAFDRVSWQFLFHTMEHFNFGSNFLKRVLTLYSNPQASTRFNGYKSASFKLECGCRQGCALSPLLFAISIEPFAQLMRQSAAINGIVIGREEYKILLYTADVVLYQTNPQSTIPQLKKLIVEFSERVITLTSLPLSNVAC